MKPVLYSHPFSSYCQKVLIALYENETAFDTRTLGEEAGAYEELCSVWPVKKFPMLEDGERVVHEASTIIEYLQLYHPGPVQLVPEDAKAALEVRILDRFFDNYVSTPQQKIVFDAIRKEANRDPYGVKEARDMLDAAYGWLEKHIEAKQWAAGERFTLADCAAAPSLFYADWSHPIGDRFPNVTAYRSRLLARPSFARAVNKARPYRQNFPLGAPDRD